MIDGYTIVCIIGALFAIFFVVVVPTILYIQDKRYRAKYKNPQDMFLQNECQNCEYNFEDCKNEYICFKYYKEEEN